MTENRTLEQELEERLFALQREECYCVDAVLKQSPSETTERVYFLGATGAKQGPYVRKYIKQDSGLGSAYETVFAAQKNGKRFLGLPQIIDCYNLDDCCVVIMECIQSETLEEVVKRCGPSAELAQDVIAKLCHAVAELHEQFNPPIIHRDLKPSNIMLSAQGLTVVDLGIAREYKPDAQTDTRYFGTRSYAPPEQFGFEQTTVRTDVYALGMMLYFCLTGKTPLPSAHHDGFPDPEITPEIRAVIMKATAFAPQDRYASVHDLLAAAQRAFGQPQPQATCSDATATPMRHIYDPIKENLEEGIKENAIKAERIHSQQRDATPPYASLSHYLNLIPIPLCKAYNALVLIVVGIIILGCCICVFTPPSSLAETPLNIRIATYGCMAGVFTTSGYLMLDRRRLRARFAILKRWSILQEFIAGFFIVGALLLGVGCFAAFL